MPLANQLAGFNRRFSFLCDELGSDTALEVVSFEGEESLGRLYRFEILLVSASNDIDEQKLLGQQAVFQLNDGVPGGEDTRYCGLITAFEQQHQITGWTFYKAVLAPKFWRLGQFHLTEVYLDKTPRELLAIVLNAGGLNSDDYTLSYLQPAGYPKQKFICQYRESYLNFITRWCEHLGVYWWYGQQQNSEQIVFGNSYRNHDPQVISLTYQPAGELDANVTGARRVQLFNVFSQPLPKQVTVTNYFYQKASLQIKGTAIVSEQGIGEVNYYGMHVESNEIAQEVAKIRAEGLICRGRQFSGESTATGLRCGHFLELSGHYRASFNQKYLLTRVSHRGSQAGLLLAGLGMQAAESDKTFYLAEFSAIPAEVQFRPELVHPWPRIEGTLNAFIDAEGSGKYAELNDDGEYKVQLPYYLTEKDAAKASAWIRMASPYAGTDDEGSSHGMHFPLHKGTEVLLSFHNGNPDKPVIIGAVTNSQTPNVVANENQTQSVIQTAGGNSMEFHDQEGQVGMHFYSPTAETYFSMGALPPAAKGVGADATGGAPPMQAPTFSSAATDTSGSRVVMTYAGSYPLESIPAPAASDFTVSDNGTPLIVNSVVVDSDKNTVTLTLAGPVKDAMDSVTVAYSPVNDPNPIQDAKGNKAAALAATSVTNNLHATGTDIANATKENNAAIANAIKENNAKQDAKASPYGSYTTAGGVTWKTKGSMKLECQDSFSDVMGATINNYIGLYASNYLTSYFSLTEGFSTTFVLGAKTTMVLGPTVDINFGYVKKITSLKGVKELRSDVYEATIGKVTHAVSGLVSRFSAGDSTVATGTVSIDALAVTLTGGANAEIAAPAVSIEGGASAEIAAPAITFTGEASVRIEAPLNSVTGALIIYTGNTSFMPG